MPMLSVKSSNGLNLKKFLSFVGTVRHQAAIRNHVEDKISRCGDGAATNAPALGRNPVMHACQKASAIGYWPQGAIHTMMQGNPCLFVNNVQPLNCQIQEPRRFRTC
jgi:hypothetical protein